ncbi:MAG: hypothetical protein AAF515_03570 [Pseudomonadota bacterium]
MPAAHGDLDPNRADVPEELAPWVPWVLAKHDNLACPRAVDTGKPAACAWYSKLAIDVTDQGLGFRTLVDVYAPGRVYLPGSISRPPVAVRRGEETLVVLGGRPSVWLTSGRHEVSGLIPWTARPSSVAVPPQTAAIELRLDGERVARPRIDRGRLYFGRAADGPAAAAARNSLDVDVYRELRDGYPLLLRIVLELSVAGSARLVTLGRTLPEGFRVTEFDSDLPARLNSDGNLQVQLEPGEHEVSIVARATSLVTEIGPNPATPDWPPEEIWAFVPNRRLQLTRVSGGTPIDLNSVGTPFDADSARGYVLRGQERLQLAIEQRGNPNPLPNQFSITREMWLHFAGDGVITRDMLNADVVTPARLGASYPLGRISIDGDNALINRLQDGSEPGVELGIGEYRIEAVSALPDRRELTASGWRVDAQELRASLYLPPGWRLLWARGVDRAPDAWLERFGLWDLFVLVLATVLAWRFLGRGFAFVTLAALVAGTQPGTPLPLLWLIGIALLALLRQFGATDTEAAGGGGRLRRWGFVGAWLWLAMTAIVAVGFAVSNARTALYPQLDRGSVSRMQQEAFQFDAVTDKARTSMPADIVSSTVRSSAAIEEIVVTGARVKRYQYADDLEIQTGPGLPNWRWRTARLIWDGPVPASQPLDLTLAGPAAVRFGHAATALLALLLSGLLLAGLVPDATRARLPGVLRRVAPVILAVLLVGYAEPGAAELPDAELLKELEQRLLEPPACFPGCASIERATLTPGADELGVELIVHSGAFVALDLPNSEVWQIASAAVGGRDAALTRAPSGGLQIALSAGTRVVALRGSLIGVDRATLNWPVAPARIAWRGNSAWTIAGLVDGRAARGSLTLLRRDQSKAASASTTLTPDPAPPFVEVERELIFDREWLLRTTVSRLAPERGAMQLEVALLPGEEVLDESIKATAGAAQVFFGVADRAVSWSSRMEPRSSLELTAPALRDRFEIWSVQASNFWHVATSGLDTLADDDSLLFRPQAGETLELSITATVPVDGPTLTVQQLDHSVDVGSRLETHRLIVRLRASQGGTVDLRLPDGDNTLNRLSVNGRDEPIPLTDNVITLPVNPGEPSYEIEWQRRSELAMLHRVAAPGMALPLSNVTTEVSLPRDRWVLLLGGPTLGPALQFWPVLVVVLVLALLLSRLPGIPLTRTDALFLSLGLAIASLELTLLMALWFLAFRARGVILAAIDARWLKNLVQIALAGFGLITGLALVLSVPNALLGTPEMQIEGNGSSGWFLRWFVDRADGVLPSPWVFSVPLWIYRVMMLVWSLWLAFALIRWATWGFRTWSQPDYWYGKPARDETHM